MGEVVPPEVPGYLLLGRLGAGGMGTVFRAERRSDGEAVAVKILHAPAVGGLDASLRSRFRREIDVLKGLDHPGVVTILDSGTLPAGGEPFLVMELLRGRPLHGVDGFGAMSEAAALGLIRELARVLVYLHGRGLVHRDLKPSNVMVEPDGRVVVLDFGLVHVDAATRLTATGTLLGTLATMAPEQFRGEETGPGTDLWQLGVTVWAALTGGVPFPYDELLAASRGGDVRPPASVRPDLSASFSAALRRCVEPDLRRRWASARELMEALDGRDRRGATIGSSSPSLPTRCPASRPRVAWMAFVLLLLALVVVAGFGRRGGDSSGSAGRGVAEALRQIVGDEAPDPGRAGILGAALRQAGDPAVDPALSDAGVGYRFLAGRHRRAGVPLRAWECFEALDQECRSRGRVLPPSLLEELFPAADGAGAMRSLADMLARSGSLVPEPAARSLLLRGAVRAYLVAHERLVPYGRNDRAIVEEELEAALACLAPVVRDPSAPGGLEAVYLATLVLRRVGTSSARTEMAGMLEELADRTSVPEGEAGVRHRSARPAGLFLARFEAAQVVADGAAHMPVRYRGGEEPETGQVERGERLLRRSLGLARSAQALEFCRLRLAEYLSHLDRRGEAERLIRDMRPELIPHELRWSYHAQVAIVYGETAPLGRALDACILALQEAPPEERVALEKRRDRLRLLIGLGGGGRPLSEPVGGR